MEWLPLAPIAQQGFVARLPRVPRALAKDRLAVAGVDGRKLPRA